MSDTSFVPAFRAVRRGSGRGRLEGLPRRSWLARDVSVARTAVSKRRVGPYLGRHRFGDAGSGV